MTPDAYLEAIERAYQGEVYGEALYRLIADDQVTPERAWKWRVMAQMEFETGHLMRRLVARHGGEISESRISRDDATRDFARYRSLAWPDLMRIFSSELDADIAEYAELEQAGPPRDRWVLRRLTEHEVVTKRFCDLELAGREDVSIEPVLHFCRRPPRR